MEHVDRNALKNEFEDLRKELISLQNEEDLTHLNNIVFVSNIFTLIGICTLCLPWYFVIPSVVLSTGTFARWTMIAHHTCHGGYDQTKDSRYNRITFAVGSFKRRFNDWFDWMLPEAWNVEHNNLHHYNLGEITDPDLVEENLKYLRTVKLPIVVKQASIKSSG